MKTNTQQGFTLIELVMVIVILGVLAATALPRFANMQADARVATLNGAFGAVNSAIGIVHAQALVKNKLGENADTIDLDGATGITLAYGYPTADAAGIGAAVKLEPAAEYTLTGGKGSATIDMAKAKTAASCRITYTAATSASAPATATITATDGC